MNVVTVDNDVLSEIGLTIESVLMWWGWLVDGPVVVWWVLDWVTNLEEVIVNSIDDDISHSEVFSSLHSVVVRWRWLVDGPVVEWWVVNWVFNLGELGGKWCWLVGDQVLQGSSCNVLSEKSAEVIGIRLLELDEADSRWSGSLGKLGSEWCWLVGDEILEGTSGDVLSEKSAEVVGIGLLGELGGEWCWLVGDQVLEGTSGDVLSEKSAEVIGIGLLGELGGKGCWLVSDQVLEGTSGDVLSEKSAEVIGIRLHLTELDHSSGDWHSSVGDQILERLLGDVFSVHLSNDLSNTDWCSLWSISNIVWLNIIIIIRESLIEQVRKSLSTLEFVWGVGDGVLWLSSDHH